MHQGHVAILFATVLTSHQVVHAAASGMSYNRQKPLCQCAQQCRLELHLVLCMTDDGLHTDTLC